MWSGAGWWTAARSAGIKAPGASCRNARAISQQPGRRARMSARSAWGGRLFQRPDDPKKYLRGIGDEWETELNDQRASPLWSDGDVSWVHGNHEMVLLIWVLYQRAVACSEGLWRNSVFSYLCLNLFEKSKSVTIYLFILDTYIYVIYLFIWEYIFTVRYIKI